MLRRVIQHARADAEFPVLHLQNGMVDTATATAPKSIVVRQLVETHRHITQCRVHLHHRIATRQRENLRMRPTHTSQRERVVLDTLGNVPALIVGMHNQSRRGHIRLVAPRFDVTEAHKCIAQFRLLAGVKCQHSLALLHLGCHILMSAFRNPCPTLLCRFADGVEYQIHIFLVSGICHNHLDSVFVSHN